MVEEQQMEMVQQEQRSKKKRMREEALQEKEKMWKQQTQKCSHCTLPRSKVIVHTCHYVNAFLKGDRLICFIIGKKHRFASIWHKTPLTETKLVMKTKPK